MRFGLVGYGAWGKHHAEAIVQAPGAELVSIACKSQESMKAARARFPEILVTADYHEILNDPSIEAVDIVVPTHLHAKIGVAALRSGKHVLLEKPMALTVEECDALIEASVTNDRVLSIGHEFRLSTQWGTLKSIIDRGEIGVPIYALVSLFRFPYRKGSENWRYDLNKVGSWILEEPIHFFDFVQWYLGIHGDPISIAAYGNTKSGSDGLYDNFTAIIKYQSGAYAIVTQSIGGFEHHQLVEICGTEGAIRTTWAGSMDRTSNPDTHISVKRKGTEIAKEIVLERPSGELFELHEQLRRTVECFRTGRPLYAPEDGRKLVKVCLEAERSLRANKEIYLEF